MKPDSGEFDPTRYATARGVAEWAYASGKAYSDPFNELQLDVVFVDPQGAEHKVPAFWAGDQIWRIRYSPALAGRYTYRTVSTDASNPDLHGRRGILEVTPYTGDNALNAVRLSARFVETGRVRRSALARIPQLSSAQQQRGIKDCSSPHFESSR